MEQAIDASHFFYGKLFLAGLLLFVPFLPYLLLVPLFFVSFFLFLSFLLLRTSFESALITREKLVKCIIQFFILYKMQT